MIRRQRLVAAAAVGVGIWALVPTLYIAVTTHPLSPDAIEYLGISNAFCHGAGFVDGVQYEYYQKIGPPLPAFSIRAPMLPILATIPLCLGATLRETQALHAVWAALIAAGMVVVASRWMSVVAAAAAAIMVTGLPAWRFVAATPLTEATSFGVIILVLASCGGVLRSIPGALICAAATVLAWMCRPNLAVFLPAVALAVIWHRGIVGSLRWLPLHVYVFATAALIGLIRVAVVVATGARPYEGYAYLFQVLDVAEARQFGMSYDGWTAFVAANWDGILRKMGTRIVQFGAAIASPMFSRLGWIVVPAIVYQAVRRETGIETRVAALGAIALGLLVIANYGSFEALRFPLIPVLLGILCAAECLARFGRAWQRRCEARGGRSSTLSRDLLGVAALVLAVALSFPEAPLGQVRATVEAIASGALRRAEKPEAVCAALDRDALVAAENPWKVFLSCGNATLWLPTDLAKPGVLDQFLDQKQPAYLFALTRQAATLARSPRLRAVGSFGDKSLFEVRDRGSAATPWSAPPPLRCAGLGDRCARPGPS